MISKKSKWRAGFVVACMIFASVACAQEQRMGILSIATPQQFESLGEVDRIWGATVKPDTEYEIVVRPLNSESVFIGVRLYDTTCGVGEKNLIARIWESVDGSKGAMLTFNGPQSGRVCMVVTAGLGDPNQSLGEFIIELKNNG